MKEELLTEQHSNELRMKHIMSDMEQMVAAVEESVRKREVVEKAYKAIIKALEDKMTHTEITRLKGRNISVYKMVLDVR